MAQISQNTISSTIALPPREEGTGHKQKMRSPELGRPPFWERPNRGPLGTRFPTLSDALMKLAAEYVAQSHKQLAAGQRHPQLDPLGFGD